MVTSVYRRLQKKFSSAMNVVTGITKFRINQRNFLIVVYENIWL